MKTKQQIFDEIKSADNKQLFALCGEYANQYRKAKKEREEKEKLIESNKGGSNLANLMDDKDALRVHVLQHLFQESEKGNAQASDKLARLAGLSESAQDIVIEVVSYSEASTIKSKSTQETAVGVGGSDRVDGGMVL